MDRSSRVSTEPGGRKPAWLKKRLPDASRKHSMESMLRERGLHTVCESASCPNLGTCFERGTATFMIMGDVCTRQCRFCGVERGAPLALDVLEPERVADAAGALGLEHVVVTSVTRDDLVDGGASHYVATIDAVRARCPGATVEVLIPDFGGRRESLETVLTATPEVVNHNVETVPRLYSAVRPQAEYGRSLRVLGHAASVGSGAVKSGVMVGLGEQTAEVEDVLRDLRGAGVNMVTIGQYLRPRRESIAVGKYLEPEMFEHYAQVGEGLGMLVHAGPFVRSSFRAGETFAQASEQSGKSGGGELQ